VVWLAPEPTRAISGQGDQRQVAVRGLHHRRMQVGHGRSGRADDGHRPGGAADDAERQKGRRPLVDADVQGQPSGDRGVVQGDRQRGIA
jgi:hypothetical protein